MGFRCWGHRRRHAGRCATVVVGATLLALPVSVLPATGQGTADPTDARRPAPGPAAAQPLPAAGDGQVVPSDEEAEPVRGDEALERLGDDLPEVARLNDLSPRRLGELLEDDPAAWVAADGRVFFRDPAPARAEVESAPEPAPGSGEAAAPLADTFALHSRPGAQRTIFLDFDGGTVSGTAWNHYDGVGTSHPAWDPAGDGAAFSDTERAKVQAVWQMVAADFAAFDVDVTTEDPGEAGLERTTSDDQTYGARVLITPSKEATTKICGHERGCGGIAYLSVFGEVDTGKPGHQPAWVFTHALYDSSKAIAEAASHEVGHQLGLEHDGKHDSEYYGGHAHWGPIMGATYGRPVSQWSRGDYVGATETQDDLAVIGGVIGRVPDEAGSSVAAAAPLPDGPATITSAQDADTYALGQCAGSIGASATTSPLGPDLDLALTLRDAGGAVVATADPASSGIDSSRAAGMDATVEATVVPGAHYLTVEGAGRGSADEHYDDYGSVGAYELAVTGCDGLAAAGAPAAPQDVSATADPVEPRVTITWSPPADTGATPVTGYTLTRSGSATPTVLAASARSHVFGDLEADTRYTFTVQAHSASGAGPNAVVSATTAAPPARTPSQPRTFAVWWDAEAELIRLSWQPPEDDGGGAVTAYRFTADGHDLGSVKGTARSATGVGFSPGTYRMRIHAVNAAGSSPAATADVTVPALATTAHTTRAVSGRTVRLRTVVRLPAPAHDERGAPTGSVVFREDGTRLGRASLSRLDDERAVARLELRGVPLGWHTYRGTYVPDDRTRLTGSEHAATAVRVRRPSRTSVRAPGRATSGARPLVRVRVRAPGRVGGTVRFVVRSAADGVGPRQATRRVRRGTAALRLPRLRPGPVTVVARYSGSWLHAPSIGRRTIRVR